MAVEADSTEIRPEARTAALGQAQTNSGEEGGSSALPEDLEEREEASAKGVDVDLQGVAEVDEHVGLDLKATHRVEAARSDLIRTDKDGVGD